MDGNCINTNILHVNGTYGNDNVAEEKYNKNTPKMLVLSYADYIRSNNMSEIVLDEEKEFWVYPKFYSHQWEKWKATGASGVVST